MLSILYLPLGLSGLFSTFSHFQRKQGQSHDISYCNTG